MKKQTLALLMALVLVLGLFAGCGGKETATEAPAQTETPAATDSAAPAQETAQASAEPAAEEPAAESAAEEPAAEPAPEEPPAAPAAPGNEVGFSTDSENAGQGKSSATVFAQPENPIEYPISDGSDVISIWTTFDARTFEGQFNSNADFPSMPYMLEKTGIQLDLTEVSQTVVTEQYQLMVAAGGYCDLIPTSYYTGEAIQAYADDVIIDLTDLLPENAPNFWAQLQTYTPAEQYSGTSDGLWLTMPSFVLSTISDSGYYTRGDWLEALDLAVPSNFEEFMTTAYAMYDAYGCDHTINIGTDCTVAWGNSWFDVATYAVSGTDPAMYLKDGAVVSGLTQDNYRSYLEWFIGLYQDGLFDRDFYAAEQNRDETLNLVGSGGAAFFSGMADHANDYYNYATDPNFELQPLPNIVNDQGFVYQTPTSKVGGSAGMGGGGSNAPSISVDCADPAFVVQWLNWFFTEEGTMYANYGTPGLTWNYDENGDVVYTDLIVNNPDGLNSMQAFTIYGWSLSASYSIGTKFLDTYPDDVREAITLWSDVSNVRYDQDIPTGAGLDASESSSIINQLSDVCAYADEAILKWIVGETPLDDASWEAYCDTMSRLGLDEITAVYQQAYSDYCEQFGIQ